MGIGETAGDAENHFPRHRQLRISFDDSFDGFTKLALRLHGTYPRTYSEIDKKMTRRWHERRFMGPTRLDGVDRSLRRHQSGSVFFRIFGKPLFQQPYYFGGVNNGISTFHDMAYASVILISSQDHFEPT